MNENDAPLNFNPFANDIQGFIVSLINKAIHNLQTCIPAIVSKVEDRKYVKATPAVQQLDSKWASVPWADIRLPVVVPFGGGIVMSWPLAAGDTGWIIAGDLDPSLFFQDPSRPQKQNILNRHSYQFGFFLPDKIAGFTLSAEDDGAFVIATEDGKTKISLKSGGITIASSDTLNINGKSVNIKTNDNASVVIDGVNFKGHTHTTTIAQDTSLVNPETGTTTTKLELKTGGVN